MKVYVVLWDTDYDNRIIRFVRLSEAEAKRDVVAGNDGDENTDFPWSYEEWEVT